MRRAWLGLVVAAGLAIVALSFVDAWIVHERVLDGEGYRTIVTVINAWQLVSLPLVSLGVIAAGLAALLGTVSIVGHHGPGGRVPRWILPTAAAIATGLLVAALLPIAQQGHASRINLRPDWAAFGAVVLAATMLIAALLVARPRAIHLAALIVMPVLLLGAAGGGRWLQLQWREGSNVAWSDGTYTRAATAAHEAETLAIESGRYRIGDRWEGSWDSSGWTVMLDDDPACPGSRGTYHAHGHPTPQDDDLRFVKVVDTCAERAAVLESGTWLRNP